MTQKKKATKFCTFFQYEEIIPIEVPDVVLHEHQKEKTPPKVIEEEPPKDEPSVRLIFT